MSASKYLHKTPASCKAAGCTLTHITLESLASSCSRAWQGARKGLDMRKPIREYARTGMLKQLGGRSVGVLLQGTKSIATQAESAAYHTTHGTQHTARCSSCATSQRSQWYWHPGDPDIAVVESIIMTKVPCNSEDGPVCCICTEPAHDGDDLRQVYSKLRCCSHKFHRECIDGWFKGHQGQCPVCRATHENVTCEKCGKEGGVIVCSRCPRVFHVTPQCLGNEHEDARALLAVQERTRPWDCPTCVQDRDKCSQQQSSPERSLPGGSSDDEDRSLLDIARGARGARGARKGKKAAEVEGAEVEAAAVSATVREKRQAKEPKEKKSKRPRGEDDNDRSALSSSSSASSTAGPVSSSSSSSKR